MLWVKSGVHSILYNVMKVCIWHLGMLYKRSRQDKVYGNGANVLFDSVSFTVACVPHAD